MEQFNTIALKAPETALHDLSHEHKTTLKIGDLTPVLALEILPGDNIRLSTEQMMRTVPMLSPLMHRMNVHIHHWFIPKRLIQKDWGKFITGGKTRTEIVNHPKFIGTYADWEGLDDKYFGVGSLADHLGVPVDMLIENGSSYAPFTFSQDLFRAYQLIWNEFYRDNDLIPEVEVLDDNVDLDYDNDRTIDLLTMRKRAYEKDYFTSARPSAQGGDPVTIGLSGTAQVSGTPHFHKVTDNSNATGDASFEDGTLEGAGIGTKIASGLTADLTTASAISVRDLRTALALQRWLERSMRGGYRYTEYLSTTFGVTPSDASLQRPQFIGGGKLPINIGDVLQTSQTSGSNYLGQMAGRGISAGSQFGFSKTFEEHGYVISLLSITPRTGYSQGLPKIFRKYDRFDYFDPLFAHVGEAEIKNSELYLSGSEVTDNATFGYAEKDVEYRQMPDRVSGQFRTSLAYWGMNRVFGSLPTLNKDFIEVQDSADANAFAATGTDHYIFQIWFNIKSFRKVPKYGEPR